MELAAGVAPDGPRIVSAANLDATWHPQVTIHAPGNPGVPPEFVSMAQGYGLGWVVGDYRGQPLLWHSGETLGFHAQTVFLPDADLGLVVLTNGISADFFTYAVQFRLFELVFGQPATFDPVVTAVIAASRGNDCRHHRVERRRLTEHQLEQAELDRIGEEVGADAVGQDDQTEVRVRQKNGLRMEAKGFATMPEEPLSAVVADYPAQPIALGHGHELRRH